MQTNDKAVVVPRREARILRALKPLRRTDERRCAYLYDDGTLMVWYSRKDNQTGAETSYWKIAREVASVTNGSKGRLILHYGAPFLLLAGPVVSWKAESIENGSVNSKRLGLAVGSVWIGRGGFRDDAHLIIADGVVSCDFSIQESATRPVKFDEPVVEEIVPSPDGGQDRKSYTVGKAVRS